MGNMIDLVIHGGDQREDYRYTEVSNTDSFYSIVPITGNEVT